MGGYYRFSMLLPFSCSFVFASNVFPSSSLSFLVSPRLLKGLRPGYFSYALCFLPSCHVQGLRLHCFSLTSLRSACSPTLGFPPRFVLKCYLPTFLTVCAPICSHMLWFHALFRVCTRFLPSPHCLLCLPAFIKQTFVIIVFWCNVGSLLNSLQFW
jgi:hypothetical protein